MTPLFRKIAAATGATCCAIALASCGSGASESAAGETDCGQSDLETVRVSEVIHSVFYAPQFVAQSQGFFCEEGIKIDTTTSDGSDKGTAAILSGSADVALVGPETAIYLRNNPENTINAKVFAQVTKTGGSFLVGRTEDQDFDWTDLKGKSVIGWRKGSSPQMVLEYILKSHNLEPNKDVKVLTNIAAPAMAGAFLSGEANYVTLYEPTVTTVTSKEGTMLKSLGEEIGEMPQTVYTATTEYIESNPDTIQRFTNAVAKAQAWLQSASPDAVADALEPYFETDDHKSLVETAKSYQGINGWPESPLMTKDGYKTLEDVMMAGGELEKSERLPYEDIVERSFANKAAQNIEE